MRGIWKAESALQEKDIMRKKILADIKLDDVVFPNTGVGTYNGCPARVDGALPGSTVRALLTKKHGVYYAGGKEVIEPSPLEIRPDCAAFGVCGGCAFRNISYADELALKERMVKKLFENCGADTGGFEYLGIEPAPDECRYRGKMEFSFGDGGLGTGLRLGMRKRYSMYEVAAAEDCRLVDGDFNAIRRLVHDFFLQTPETFYRKSDHTGALRNLIIRKGHYTGEILVNLVTTSALKTDLGPLVSRLTALATDGRIVGILRTVNDSPADAVICQRLEVLSGQAHYHELLCGYSFKISAFSFFQTNAAGAQMLYSTVREFAAASFLNGARALSGPPGCRAGAVAGSAWDLYCGTGTISQILSDVCGSVVGVELIPEAVEAARENAAANGIRKCAFIVGDVLEFLNERVERPQGHDAPGSQASPYLIIADPPRSGINARALERIATAGARNIVYVSCNPHSLCRDLAVLQQRGYVLSKLKLHDMFPRTAHVETIVSLRRQNT